MMDSFALALAPLIAASINAGTPLLQAIRICAEQNQSIKMRRTLEEIAAYPLITYDSAYSGRNKVDHAFAVRSLKPEVLLEAIDADVIKTYVELGMGVGIIAGMAYDAERDKNLRAIPVGHLFGVNVSRVAVKQGAYLRSYIYTFIELLTPTLNRKLIEQVLSGEKESYEL